MAIQKINNESPNKVIMLASASKQKTGELLKQGDGRKTEFSGLLNKMVNSTPQMGREIITVSENELYDVNILKGDQESKVKK